MEANLAEMAAKLAKYLGRKRYQHSLNVAATAHHLAQLHAPHLAVQAELAGLLHDNAKQLTDGELIEQAAVLDIEVSAAELEQPSLLHGKVGAVLALKRFRLKDAEVCQAMADHVTGRAAMGLLSQLLFVADQIAIDREFPGVVELRRVAEEDLTRAVLLVAGYKLRYVIESSKPVHSETVNVYNEFAGRVREQT